MSEQEQHTIAGKMMADYVQVKRELAALQAKAKDVAQAVRLVGEYLTPRIADPHSSGADFNGKYWTELFNKLPAKEDIGTLASEIADATARKQDLWRSLKQLGFEPKD